METNTPTTQYKQVTVDVPEDRLAEFHAFVGRFLAGPSRPRTPRTPRPAATAAGMAVVAPDAARPPSTQRATGQPAETTEL